MESLKETLEEVQDLIQSKSFQELVNEIQIVLELEQSIKRE